MPLVLDCLDLDGIVNPDLSNTLGQRGSICCMKSRGDNQAAHASDQLSRQA